MQIDYLLIQFLILHLQFGGLIILFEIINFVLHKLDLFTKIFD